MKTSLKKVDVNLPDDIFQKLNAISDACDKSLHWVIVRALKTYLLNEGQDVLNSIEGRKQIANGDFEDIEDVIASLEAIIDARGSR